MSREQEFLAQLPVIDRVIGWVCARRSLRGADAQDFASTVRLRLIENDYEILARFEGRSSLKTYLVVVVNRLYLDFQVQRFGKWRPSTEARRLGPLAVEIERLVCRDRLSFDEACGVLLTGQTWRKTSRDEIEALFARLPVRRPRSAPGDGEPIAPESDAAERRERQELADRVFAVIRRTLARLPPQDRLLMRLHLQSGMTIADVSRALATDQKALYRRREEILERLLKALKADGIGAENVQDLLQTLDWDAGLGDEDGAQSGNDPE